MDLLQSLQKISKQAPRVTDASSHKNQFRLTPILASLILKRVSLLRLKMMMSYKNVHSHVKLASVSCLAIASVTLTAFSVDASPLYTRLNSTDTAIHLVQSANPDEPKVVVDDLNAAISRVRERLKALQSTDETGSVATLAPELEAAKARIQELSERLDAERAERESMESDAAASIAEAVSLRERQLAAEQRINDLIAHAKDLRDERDQTALALDASRESITVEQGKVATLRQELQQISGSIADKQTQLNAASAQIQKLRESGQKTSSELAGANVSIASLEEEKAELIGIRDDQARQISLATDKIGELTASLQDREQRIQTALSDIEKLEAINDQRSVAIAELEGEKSDALAEIERLNGVETSLRAQVASLETAARTSTEEIAALGEELINTMTALQDTSAALGEARASRKIISDELLTLKSDFVPVTADRDTIRGELRQANARITQLTAERDRLNSRLDTLALGEADVDQDAEVAAALDAAKSQIASLNTRLAGEAEKRRSVEAQLEAIKTQSDERVQELVRVSAIAAPTDEDTSGSAQTISQLQAEIDILTAENARLNGQIADRAAAAATDADAQLTANVADEDSNEEEIQLYLAELRASQREDGLLLTMPEAVMFAPGADTLAPEAADSLERVSQVISFYGASDVTIFGHTDSIGDEDPNQRLSERRAASVQNDLAANYDLEEIEINVIGLGETEPVASNLTEAGRRANRRVEILISGGSIGEPDLASN